ncbi:MAG: hypothetical protein J6N72_05680 [Psychrobacter sp.]|nr:hypothetical protein [Psychrobacter sp.]
MSNTSQRTKINIPSDIPDGCGVGVKIESLVLTKISIDEAFFPVQKCLSSSINAAVTASFLFEAGYTLRGNYHVTIDAGSKNIDSLQSKIDLVNEAVLTIGLDAALETPFSNWWLLASDEAVLSEIMGSSDEWSGVEDIDLKLGESVVFSYEDDCRDVADGMLNNINIMKSTFPKTGFTKELVTDLHRYIKHSICDSLIACNNFKNIL